MASFTKHLLALVAIMLQTHQFTLGAATPYWERQVAVLPSYVVDYGNPREDLTATSSADLFIQRR